MGFHDGRKEGPCARNHSLPSSVYGFFHCEWRSSDHLSWFYSWHNSFCENSDIYPIAFHNLEGPVHVCFATPVAGTSVNLMYEGKWEEDDVSKSVRKKWRKRERTEAGINWQTDANLSKSRIQTEWMTALTDRKTESILSPLSRSSPSPCLYLISSFLISPFDWFSVFLSASFMLFLVVAFTVFGWFWSFLNRWIARTRLENFLVFVLFISFAVFILCVFPAVSFSFPRGVWMILTVRSIVDRTKAVLLKEKQNQKERRAREQEKAEALRKKPEEEAKKQEDKAAETPSSSSDSPRSESRSLFGIMVCLCAPWEMTDMMSMHQWGARTLRGLKYHRTDRSANRSETGSKVSSACVIVCTFQFCPFSHIMSSGLAFIPSIPTRFPSLSSLLSCRFPSIPIFSCFTFRQLCLSWFCILLLFCFSASVWSSSCRSSSSSSRSWWWLIECFIFWWWERWW